MVFEEDIEGLREFIRKAKKRELRAIDILELTIFILVFILGTILMILKVKFKIKIFIIILVFSICFIVFSIVFALLFMKKDPEEYAKLISFIVGITLGDIAMEFYDWYTGWEPDPARVPWLEKWEDPGFYLGCLVTAITAIIIYKSIKKFYGDEKMHQHGVKWMGIVEAIGENVLKLLTSKRGILLLVILSLIVAGIWKIQFS